MLRPSPNQVLDVWLGINIFKSVSLVWRGARADLLLAAKRRLLFLWAAQILWFALALVFGLPMQDKQLGLNHLTDSEKNDRSV